jgi:hypothetical protein
MPSALCAVVPAPSSYLKRTEHILVFEKGAMDSGYTLKLIYLAASVHVRTHGLLEIQLTVEARTPLQNSHIRF